MICIALDDEPLALKVLKHYVNEAPGLESKGYFTNPDIARSCLESEQIDLLFLDIQMPDITGLQFFKTLAKKPMVIFTTAYREFAVEGFELEAIDYLLKPIELERFQRAVQKATDYLSFLTVQKVQPSNLSTHIFIKSEYRVLKIDLEDLYLVETLDDYLKLYLYSSPKPIMTLMTMKSIVELLPPNRFMRVHRSYLVALDKVTSLRNKRIKIEGKEIPVGTTYLGKVRAIFQ